MTAAVSGDSAGFGVMSASDFCELTESAAGSRDATHSKLALTGSAYCGQNNADGSAGECHSCEQHACGHKVTPATRHHKPYFHLSIFSIPSACHLQTPTPAGTLADPSLLITCLAGRHWSPKT